MKYTRVIGPSLYYHRRVGGKLVQVKLGRLDEGAAVLRARYQALLAPQPRTVDDMLTGWQTEKHQLAPKTRAEYDRQIDTTLRPVLGNMALTDVKPSTIGQYLERRQTVSANREVACLSTVYEWAIRNGYAEFNPCRGVRRNRETPRHRYVSNVELGQALKRTTPEFRDFMLAAYFTGFRQADLRRLKWTDIDRRQITLTEAKTGKKITMRLSKPLAAVLGRARGRTGSDYVFTNTSGQPWSLWAVQSAMRRLDVDWTFHDLRAKAESDHRSGLGLLSRYKRARQLEPTR